jgi:hypothetical protein
VSDFFRLVQPGAAGFGGGEGAQRAVFVFDTGEVVAVAGGGRVMPFQSAQAAPARRIPETAREPAATGACLATARWMKATAVTCDEAWTPLAGEIKVLVPGAC